jgi:hypothetical protein
MIQLTDEQTSLLKQGYTVRVSVPELDGDVIVVLAAQRESTESVLVTVSPRSAVGGSPCLRRAGPPSTPIDPGRPPAAGAGSPRSFIQSLRFSWLSTSYGEAARKGL